MSPCQLHALGTPRLELTDKSLTLKRRAVAVLCYLALEGPTTRSKIAGLLWPDSHEATARNNLAQLLSRLRQSAGEPLVIGSDILKLHPDVSVDAANLKVRAFSGDAQGVLAHSGELLAGVDFDDLPEFSDWLGSEREALRSLYRQALETLIERAEKSGRYKDAIPFAEALIAQDSVSETAYRTLMRLQYLQGDRPMALKTYHRCKEILARELGVDPLPETKELARKIDQDDVSVLTHHVRTPLPSEVLRPPTLVGRDALWTQLTDAWESGKVIYIRGEPGIGKTRLAQEFVASKGKVLYLSAQPGYQAVPFAAAASLARSRIAQAPQVSLPDWVTDELSRILPEFRKDTSPPPMRAEEDKLRFFQAYFEMVRLTGQDVIATVSDDVQYYDPMTVELGSFMMSQPRSAKASGNIPRYIVVYRRDELSPTSQQAIDRLVAAGIAVIIDVEPLTSDATSALLASLLPDSVDKAKLPALSQAVYGYTGGNPLFILETLRNLLERDYLGGTLEGALPLSDKVDTIIQQRLARLSADALRVVKAAAILQSDFDLSLIGATLQDEPVRLFEAWEELEQAQFFSGQRFSHDLLYEAALRTISQPVRVLLHRRCAEVLSEHGANPARIAQHWLAAGDEMAAIPALRLAAQLATDEMRLNDAEVTTRQITEILERYGDVSERHVAQQGQKLN